MDKEIFKSISYGMYIVSSSNNDQLAGCVINTFCQINSKDPLISISLNKDNYTNKVIKENNKFSVSVISNETKKEVISKFGYQSSKNINKFDNTDYEIIDNIPVVLENVCGYFICEVVNIIDCNTHDIIIAKVTNTKKLNDNIPMTYKYYHENLKGISPKNAPTYIEDTNETIINEGSKYRCTLCGFIYDETKELIKFIDLPDDWKCPLCGATKDMFEKI